MMHKIKLIFFKGADIFQAKVNIEVQWATEPVIAAIERNGGVITTTYYDINSVFAAVDVEKFFKKGKTTLTKQTNILNLI